MVEREIVLRTRKENLISEVQEALDGTGVSVKVDMTWRGRFLDPSFECLRGTTYVGYTPLWEYIKKLQEGENFPVVDNPLGEHFQHTREQPTITRTVVGDEYLDWLVGTKD